MQAFLSPAMKSVCGLMNRISHPHQYEVPVISYYLKVVEVLPKGAKFQLPPPLLPQVLVMREVATQANGLSQGVISEAI